MKTFTNTLDIYIEKGRKKGFKEGFEIGFKKGFDMQVKCKIVKNLLNSNKCTLPEIAKLTGVTIYFVKKMQTELKLKENQ